MMDENQIYNVHCKGAFERIEKELSDIKRMLNGSNGHSLVTQVALNSAHRKWMESWGKGILISVSIATIGSLMTMFVAFAK